MKSFNFETTSFNNPSELFSLSDYDNLHFQLSNVRVICKKILYLIGIPYEIADEEILIKKEYLGQYGSIHKIIVNKNGYMKNESNFPTYSSYITYSNEIEASLALLALNNSTIFNHKLNACYGTNKYCNSFLKGIECNNRDCFYLHEYANKNDIIMKNDTQMKIQYIEQQKIAANITNIFSLEQKNIYINMGIEIKNEFKKNNIENFFPTIDTIYDKKFIQDFEKEKELQYNIDINNNNINNNNHKKYNNKEYYYKISSPNDRYDKKYKEFSSPEYENDNENEEEENEEYILVRQPSRHKKRYGFGGNKNTYKKKFYKKNNYKLKFSLEKYNIKYYNKEEEKNMNNQLVPSNYTINNENLSDESVETKIENEKPRINNDKSFNDNYNTMSNYNTNESSCQNNQQEDIETKKNIYKKSQKSRFSFAIADTDNKPNFIIPEFVNEILNKTFYSLCFNNFIKKYQNQNQNELDKSNFMENFLLEDEIKIVKKWAINN